jgi:nucleoside-diphosphate kinase
VAVPDAPAGTVRGDLGVSNRFNLVHASDSPETSASEIALWCKPGEVLDYRREIDKWVFEQ